MKKIIYTAFLVISVFFAIHAQEKIIARRMNLPPGTILQPKLDVAIDYSYKLGTISDNVSDAVSAQNFLYDFTDADLAEMKANDFMKYEYYMKANEYYNSLSNKVKSIFTIQELWYVYIFDADLSDKLITIK